MEIESLKQKNDRMFILVCLNCAMLAFLFVGSGYVLWQSARIVNELNTDLDNARLGVAELKARMQQLDVDAAMDRVMSDATEKIKESVGAAVQNSELGGPLTELSQRVQGTQEKLDRTSDAIVEINSKLSELDTQQLAQLVSFNMLQGLGEGFTQAAESRKP
jgi:predicted  nucleic acid-binding Zn-ribbon protein